MLGKALRVILWWRRTVVEVSQQLDKDAVSIGRIDQDLAPVEGIDMVVALKRDLLILETLQAMSRSLTEKVM
ncbi:MAG: hypothetical protein R2735_03135 [Microthrixaceae bacterium]